MKNTKITDIDEFTRIVKSTFEYYINDEYIIEPYNITRENSMVKGILIGKKDADIAIIVYIEELFKKYKNENTSIIDIVFKITTMCAEQNINIKLKRSIIDFKHYKDRICYRLINAENNSELLLKTPHRIICEDLAIILYIQISDITDENVVRVGIDNNTLSMWEINSDEIFDIALQNTQNLLGSKIVTLEDMIDGALNICNSNDLKVCFKEPIISERVSGIYVCTNSIELNGAGVILYDNLLRDFANKIDSDLYILPSSIHEVLLVPMFKYLQPSTLRGIVSEVNSQMITKDSFLSNSVYIYRRADDKITIVKD